MSIFHSSENSINNIKFKFSRTNILPLSMFKYGFFWFLDITKNATPLFENFNAVITLIPSFAFRFSLQNLYLLPIKSTKSYSAEECSFRKHAKNFADCFFPFGFFHNICPAKKLSDTRNLVRKKLLTRLCSIFEVFRKNRGFLNFFFTRSSKKCNFFTCTQGKTYKVTLEK